jgi:glycosyltransferase involved in cell wall biosynthesis
MDRGAPKVSLILATVGRTGELARFLAHLERQTYREFELIVVDQNPVGVLDPLVRRYRDKFPLLYLRSERGLSRARNVGLAVADGDIVAFPDDDCWYPPGLLQHVVAKLEASTSLGGVSGRCIGPDGENWSRFDKFAGMINRGNLFRRATAAAMFLRAGVVQDVGLFDESMGAGAETPRRAGEEMDYLLRGLRQGWLLSYDPGLCVYHEPSVREHGQKSWMRARDYGHGFGYLLKKHQYPLWFKLYMILRAVGGFSLSLARCDFARARYYLCSSMGRAAGCFVSE